MTPQQALEILYAASTLAWLPKKKHMEFEQAKVSLAAALEKLQSLETNESEQSVE